MPSHSADSCFPFLASGPPSGSLRYVASRPWSLDILSRAFFNRPEHTSRISRFAPDQLTQATGKSKLPSQGSRPISSLFSCRRLPFCHGAGQQDSSGYSLAKEGWTRHPVNGPVPLTGADGVVRSTSNHRCLNEPPRLRPLRRLRRFFLMGAATPPLPRRGDFAPKTRANVQTPDSG